MFAHKEVGEGVQNSVWRCDGVTLKRSIVADPVHGPKQCKFHGAGARLQTKQTTTL